MKQLSTAVLYLLACLMAAPLMAQPTIGGGSCTSATISGTYAVSLTGRGVTAEIIPATTVIDLAQIQTGTVLPETENLTNVFEAIGYAKFDGQSQVTFTLTADNNLSTGAPLSWSGTYSVQANCSGSVTITTGGSAKFNLSLYNTGAAFSLTGNDPIYAYAGNGNTQATGCSTSTLSGVYAVTATQGFYALANGTAGGAGAGSGLMQFDGEGNVTINATISANALAQGVTETQPGFSLTGTYSMGSNCVGSAKVSSVQYGTFDMNFSVYTATSTLSTDMYFSMATNPPEAMITGDAYWIYASAPAQTEPGAALRRPLRGIENLLAKLFRSAGPKGGRA